MTSYSKEDKKALNEARQNKDQNEGNRRIVEIVAAKMKVQKSRLVSINLTTADHQASYDEEEKVAEKREELRRQQEKEGAQKEEGPKPE